ncbi:MAG: sulfurtransferase TusA family protein [Solirubrobacteraceae bacterium]
MTVDREPVAHRVDAEHLELGGGLEVLLAAALERVAPGGVLEVRTPSRSVALELLGWARLAGHEPVDEFRRPDGHVVAIRRGASTRILAEPLPRRETPPTLRQGELHTADLRGGAPPPDPDPVAGFAPLHAVPEAGAPTQHWRLSRSDAIWADDVAELVDQASGQQWDASRDIPWEAAHGLDDTTERAVAQVMTFLAQNEYAALYVPAGFLPQVNPQLVEVVLWLGSHVHDEARHIEVFTKRSLAGGHHGYALASTELSLSTLLDEHDFTASSLLLNVLGEGTFLDLLRFIETHAPDAATATAARLAHRDERRHVHFGISNIKRAVSIDPDMVGSLVAAAETRAAKLVSLSGLSPILVEALTVMAARSLQPAELSDAAADVRTLMQTMERNRLRRLQACGFTATTAGHLSDLHTPNLM